MTPDEVFSPLRWKGDVLYLIDQLRLPAEEVWLACRSADDVARAIRDMHVRGAPAIGCAAAYGVALAARQQSSGGASPAEFRRQIEAAIDLLAGTRPTAVNLFWALAQMRNAAVIALEQAGVTGAAEALDRRAVAIHAEDVAMCRRIGRFGAELVPDGATVLTHCNAGALATGGYGTALGVVRAAREAGKSLRIFADETRPFLQGARLTAWELLREGFDVTIIPDASAAFLLRRGEITCVIVGADRIAANGDVANKIGTYGVALAAAAARVPFYVAAPTSTIDRETATGADIPIEERSGSEMLTVGDTQIAPRGAVGRYPAFDVTPAELVSAIITDRGVARAPYGAALAKAFEEE
ncbi:MAG TPA: S-methyl-5-thioribose-1-phosphate isomerase [Kofleriaceae bacterium]|nr:S-methyl-5-thioribose-1-phosphate isomerase [Kofleriaceae bacterium]